VIKTTAPYQLPGYKILELVVISEPISGFDNYDPTNIPRSSNSIMDEEKTHSRAREQRPSRIPVQDVNVFEDDEEEEWYLDVEKDDIQDTTNINMNEIDDAVDVEEIIKKWQMSIPFINRGMKHMCAQFADNTSMSYADEPYFRKPPRINEQFGVGQRFSTKSEKWLWMKWRIVSTGCQLEVELVPTKHDLDYQCFYIFFCYIYQNNWISIFIIIFYLFDIILE
jgi:hypothetical protein